MKDKYYKYIGIVLLLIVELTTAILCLSKDINESEWCVDKVLQNFPELRNMEKVQADFDEFGISKECTFYYIQTEQRDGLKKIIDSDKGTGDKSLKFIVTEQKDIDYIGSDNFIVTTGSIALLLFLLTLFLLIKYEK